MRFNEAQVKEWVCRRLGSGTVNVELTDEQLDDSIMDAKIWWQSWVGQCKGILFTLTGSTEYAVDTIADDVDSVVDVAFEVSGHSLTDYFKWADVEVSPYQWIYGGGGGGYSALLQYTQYREMARQIAGADQDWTFERGRRVLVLTPRPNAGSTILVNYISRNVDLTYLENHEMFIFRRYALAQAMKTLATIRMKYSGKPSATGEFTMDGDALYANGEALEQDTEEKARLLQAPVGFFAE